MKKGRQLDTYGCENTLLVKDKGMSGPLARVVTAMILRRYELGIITAM